MQRKISLYHGYFIITHLIAKNGPLCIFRGCQGLVQKMKEIGDKTLGRFGIRR